MNQRKPLLCRAPYQPLRLTRCDCLRSAASGACGRSCSSALSAYPHSYAFAASGAPFASRHAKGAHRAGSFSRRDLDTTRRRVILSTMTTNGLPSLSASPTFAGMMPCAPAASSLRLVEGRSLVSLATVAGRVADGLRREPCGLMLARPLPCPTRPAAAGARGGFAPAVLIAPCTVRFSTVVSLL